MLHIVNKRIELDVFFQRIAEGDCVLFIGSAVLGLHKNSKYAAELETYTESYQCYALEPDFLARGLRHDEISEQITVVSYSGFVNLTVDNKVTKTWS